MPLLYLLRKLKNNEKLEFLKKTDSSEDESDIDEYAVKNFDTEIENSGFKSPRRSNRKSTNKKLHSKSKQ